MELNRDFSDLLSAFSARRVRFLLVGVPVTLVSLVIATVYLLLFQL